MEWFRRAASRAAKRVVRAGARRLLLLLLPYLAPLVPFLLVFFLVSVLIAATYAAMTPQGAMTGVDPSPEDQKIQQRYIELCNKYNVKDTWLVSGESSPGNPWYPGRGEYQLGEMVDRYGNDIKLKLEWGTVHSTALFWAYTFGKSEIPDQIREKVAKDLHPYYYYKKSTVTVCGKDGCESYTVYLLVEAYTIQGHYQYHYEWVTETHGEGENAVTVTYERLKDTQQILANRWQRLEDYLKDFYQLKPGDDMALNRTMVWEAGLGFNAHKEWLEWLLNNYSIGSFTSSAMIPPELMPLFKEAEEKYGIPWWFLAAVAFKESSFNSQAENLETHCYGLMQVSPENWEHYAPILGFDPVMDKDNPRAQIMVGAYLLKNYLGNVNWEGDWKEQTLPGLTMYGGFIKMPFGKPYNSPEEWCRAEYASKIWQLADNFHNVSGAWPVPGYNRISSSFGWRIHPVYGTKKFHDGIDIPAPSGTPVFSASAGVVITAGPYGAYGNAVIVKDSQHLYLYGHLSSISVQVNQTVQPGQQVGAVGNTGVSTGPHLHFGVMDLAGNHWIDPLLVVQPQ
ncbi:peptidoglycan DD-metalloendopeptidase family protein [Desulfofundulus thermobenzoicus]|uniref:Peptidoglycan DD-metalloendopeptidase family protein n=1 Tax=Desulfofundulus thermobenzoicus TaxID=29376 RepID=A0A6N7IU09_9FIRM|nr:M23 family metallopeptidase [Desulfofundulus thermobenzoicus]MQL53606.1 peptidoglycan DD-metalloendopeptidase family protein [Desulfofundulus thermobenzoicus]